MAKHWQYLKYVIRHKWFVFAACVGYALFNIQGKPLLRVRLIWRGIIHDWTKFLPSEWFPYAQYFYGDNSNVWFELTSRYGLYEAAPWGADPRDRFMVAWNLHQKRNDHHWQYWYLTEDSGQSYPVGIPLICRYEMLCDWIGAGLALGKPDTLAWYEANKDKIQFRDSDRAWVERELQERKEREKQLERMRGMGILQ
jgi:uncharacterized protein DUF5662